MQLKRFNHILQTSLEIKSHIEIDKKNIITAELRIQDPYEEASWPEKSFHISGDEVVRQDEIWKSTCFEFFLNPMYSQNYYEFNFGLQPAWNCYQFLHYRQPQPAQRSSDFEFLSMSWQAKTKTIQVQVCNNSRFKKFKVSLTAIVKDKKGETHYFALKHAGLRPDYHLLESFTIQRGS
jgi:hypothetical protein